MKTALGVMLTLTARLVLIALATMVHSASGAGELREMLELDLWFPGSSFHIPGRVPVNVQLKNISAETIVVNKAYNFQDCKLEFHIVTPSGRVPEQVLILKGRRPPLGPGDFKTLRPGGVFQTEVDLAEWFQLTEVGSYKVEAEYWNGHAGKQGGRTVWIGKIRSATRTFELTK